MTISGKSHADMIDARKLSPRNLPNTSAIENNSREKIVYKRVLLRLDTLNQETNEIAGTNQKFVAYEIFPRDCNKLKPSPKVFSPEKICLFISIDKYCPSKP